MGFRIFSYIFAIDKLHIGIKIRRTGLKSDVQAIKQTNMKKSVHVVWAMLLFVLAGCITSPKTTPLKGNPNLVTSTVKSDDGKDLISVVNPQTGQVIMQPADYSEVAGDEYVVYGKKKDGTWTLVKTNGEHIGTFEMFTPWKTNGTYYLCVTYIYKTYYFPKEDFTVTTQNAHSEQKVLFVEQEGKWLVLDYDGKTLSVLPQSFTVIKDTRIPTNMWIAVADNAEHTSCILYSLTGEVHRKLTSSEWDSLKERLTTEKELAESVRITRTENFNII